jgi:hypothetical protein
MLYSTSKPYEEIDTSSKGKYLGKYKDKYYFIFICNSAFCFCMVKRHMYKNRKSIIGHVIYKDVIKIVTTSRRSILYVFEVKLVSIQTDYYKFRM